MAGDPRREEARAPLPDGRAGGAGSEGGGSERRAVALRYRRPAPGEVPASGGAPELVARGRGAVAERILALAREHGVPVREDRDLVELLSACELGEEVPVEVWSAVAEVLAWVYALRRPAPRGE